MTVYFKMTPLIRVGLFGIHYQLLIFFGTKSEFWKRIVAFCMAFIYLFISILAKF